MEYKFKDFKMCLFFLVFTILLTASTSCPSNCKCTGNIVDCRMKGLKDFPKLKMINESHKVLNLAYNKLNFVDIPSVETGLQIEILDLSNNNLKGIHLVAIAKVFPSLQNLNLRHNNINKSDGFIHKSLQSLDLGRNVLFALSQSMFTGLTSLKELALDHNVIGYIHKDAFARLFVLEKLRLSYNSLNYLDLLWFKDLKNITLIELNHNRISSISPKTHVEWPESLEELNLSNNNLVLIPPLLNPANKMYLMDIRNNPYLYCGCKLRNYGFNYLKLHVACGIKLKCVSPPNMRKLENPLSHEECASNAIDGLTTFLAQQMCREPVIDDFFYVESADNLTCLANGNPSPMVSILQNDAKNLKEQLNVVSVKLVDQADGAICTARNPLGTVEQLFYLTTEAESTNYKTESTMSNTEMVTKKQMSEMTKSRETNLLIGIITISTVVGMVFIILGTYASIRKIKKIKRRQKLPKRPLPLIPARDIDALRVEPVPRSSTSYEEMDCSSQKAPLTTVNPDRFIKKTSAETDSDKAQTHSSDDDGTKGTDDEYEEPTQSFRETTL